MKFKKRSPSALVILDGFGYRQEINNNAIALAHTPHLKKLFTQYPNTLLNASGEAVGLPRNTPGNSETGHFTLGAGKVIEQTITKSLKSIDNGSFYHHEILHRYLSALSDTHGNLHIIGLLSDGSVHGHEKLIYACTQIAINAQIKQIFIHIILDGRDVLPQSARDYLVRYNDFIQPYPMVHIASIHGRFWAMDRDNNWDRTGQSYQVLTTPASTQQSWQEILDHSYKIGIFDEFIKPTSCDKNGVIKPKDGVIITNVRPERTWQLTQSICCPTQTPLSNTHKPPAWCITTVPYNINIDTNVATEFLFEKPQAYNTFKETLINADYRLCTIAETEKIAHVTYFFNGERTLTFPNETVKHVPSLKMDNYALAPAMSAQTITKEIITDLIYNPHDFYIINYANADMVGHSGNMNATIKSIEFLDTQLAQLYHHFVVKKGGTLFITSDHGKAEDMVDPISKQQRTAHTTNPVPFIVISSALSHNIHNLHTIADVAPYLLRYLQIPII